MHRFDRLGDQIHLLGKYTLREKLRSEIALVHLDCYKRILQIGWLTNKKCILTVLEPGKCKIRALACLRSGEDPLPGF